MTKTRALWKSARRAVMLALIGAVATTAIETQPVLAAPTARTEVASKATDFSAARRRYARRHYHGNGAAAAAAFGSFMGLMGGIIAEQQRRDYYDRYYGYGPGYYYGPPPGYYYGGPRYYGW